MNSKFFTPLVLVSKSPRRQELLQNAGYHFESYHLEVSEIIDENLSCKDQVCALSGLKMQEFKKKTGPTSSFSGIALTCDTLVEFESQPLGKPSSREEALGWLLKYSQKSQWVHTACTLLELEGKKREKTWVSSTEVFFKKISRAEAEFYLDSTPSFMDKAGGYGIQDSNFSFIEKIEGEYSNVVGLPLKDLAQELQKWEVS